MKKAHVMDIQLVVTAALKKELPVQWLRSRGVPIHTLSALKSGALKTGQTSDRGMLIVITGPGLEASEAAAEWIRGHLKPLFVVNIGTCGLLDRRLSPGQWLQPGIVRDADGDEVVLDRRLPFPAPEGAVPVPSLLSVREAVSGKACRPWKGHDTVDMECHAQARVFRGAPFSFHCLKFGTDYADGDAISDFNRNLDVFQEGLRSLFSFLDTIPPPHPFIQGGNTSGQIPVTVVIPVYNRETIIRRAVDSVLSQSMPPAEIIVVNDCSSDGTGAVLDSYGNSITVISLKQNGGPSKARNEGVRHSRAEWIAFLDSDDCWERDKLNRQVDFLRRHPFHQILQTEEIWIRNGRRVNPCRHHQKPQGWIWEPSLERCLVSPSAVLIKKSLFEEHGGFDESLPACEDYDLWLRISRHHPVGLDSRASVIKYGGHRDQRSRAYPAMDRFRVQSLTALLAKELNPVFRTKITAVLRKKLHILVQGAEKRGKGDDVKKYRAQLMYLSSEKGADV